MYLCFLILLLDTIFLHFLMLLICMNNFRSFDARRECNIRRYSYLLPVQVIGIKNSFTSEEINYHLSDFNRILNAFEVVSISANDP